MYKVGRKMVSGGQAGLIEVSLRAYYGMYAHENCTAKHKKKIYRVNNVVLLCLCQVYCFPHIVWNCERLSFLCAIYFFAKIKELK